MIGGAAIRIGPRPLFLRATRAAEEHGLSLFRCLEPANRLSPNLHGAAFNRLRENACLAADWPWDELSGPEVLRLLWTRLAEPDAGPTIVEEMTSAGSKK